MIKQLENLNSWLEQQAEKRRVIVPRREDARVLFGGFDKEKEVVLDELPFLPAKEVFLPRTEDMIKFKYQHNHLKLTPAGDFPPTLLFGVSAADLKGIRILDHAFSHCYKDPYYLERRKNTVVVTTLGPVSAEYSFFGVFPQPFSCEGADILFAEEGGVYYLESLSDKGREFLEKTDLEEAASAENLEKLKKEAVQELTPEFDIKDIEKKLDSVFENPLWEEYAAKCLGCGTCTYVCPTCYCFDIFDEKSARGGSRKRTWDGCQFRLFTLEASGHNPRARQPQRFRNRVYHKFKTLKEQTNLYACTGCGRCVRYCPVCVDIREILKKCL
ncbi:MAG: 4Fe-4S dicluster domain-containing protein [bacterium]